jgi:hypothetical protein
LGQPLGFTTLVAVGTGEGADPVELDPDPGLFPQAASTKVSAATSETSKKNDRRLSVRIMVTPSTLHLTA